MLGLEHRTRVRVLELCGEHGILSACFVAVLVPFFLGGGGILVKKWGGGFGMEGNFEPLPSQLVNFTLQVFNSWTFLTLGKDSADG